MDVDVFPVEQTRTLLHIIDGTLSFSGRYLHEDTHPIHTHSFVEIAVVMGGVGAQRSLAGRKQLAVGDVLLLRPGVWHGYEDCSALDLYNCGFSPNCCAASWPGPGRIRGWAICSGPARTRPSAAASSLPTWAPQRSRNALSTWTTCTTCESSRPKPTAAT